MNGNPVTVIREGTPYHIHDYDLRKGDLVLIQTGDMVPADLILSEVRNLEIDEFEITGELIPVFKHLSNEDVFLYMGSRVIRGSAKGIVIASGDETEYGRITNQALPQVKNRWGQLFQRKQLTVLLFFIPAFVISLLQSQNLLRTTFLFLLIGVFSIFLQSDQLFQALVFNHGQTLIGKKNISIQNSDLFKVMDDVDIICFDKTGVLTTRNIEITKIFLYSPLFEFTARHQKVVNDIPNLIKTASSLCTDVTFFEKTNFANPVDRAFLSFAQSIGVDLDIISKKYQRIYDMPFDSENRFMVSGYKTENQDNLYFLKGDPDIILNRCKDYYSQNGKKEKITFGFRSEIKARSNAISQNGDTAIALAMAEKDIVPESSEFTFLCLVQLENTLQEGAKEVVQKAIEEGIRPLMLTGDKQEAAIKIARDCGIVQNSAVALNGNVIQRMALDEIGRQSEYCSIFSRLLPSQKGIIIRQLQNRGHRVAMIGDGPNDGIALKVSDIGISFQINSSPIAKQFSSVLLNQLSDLTVFIHISNRVMKTTKRIKYLRILILLLLLITVYSCMFLQM